MSETPALTRVFLTLPDVLETGIVEIEVEIVSAEVIRRSDGFLLGGFGVTWHRHRASAWRRAGEIRRARVESLLTEIDRVNALDFGASSGGFRG
ncbi:hypothetical protein [Methylobacterium haplocladii]|uniref:Uncharacterized protein n=1 Tax=Methylobacterium haplocladii TaxID=1176176 RepID=A0A512ISC8_9HYPH|nr:hypothetical protein [Methylobacterium haplocladii]GEP00591.1 hypothetical protein MHA02_29780 [Methylobacterium haplocladii]GJD85506.1 hypothetical protein HPGCJGGD_3395 [Methylobacterium haplocladii]GLS57739.1 hypothetical protein GCM10007887_03950 [Methylobacterium haplocladii]